LGVEIAQRGGELFSPFQHLCFGDEFAPAQGLVDRLPQIDTWHKIHHQEIAIVFAEKVGDFRQVRVIEAGQDAGFALELAAVLLPPFCCAAGIGLDFLHGSVTAFEPQVRCFVEAAHPALPDHLNDLVPVAEYVAGLEVIHN